MKAKAILFKGPGQAGTGDVEIPGPGPGEVLIETSYSCVSPGTELRCLAGKQDGSPSWPYIAGYSMTGTVKARGEGADLPEGTPVFCAGTAKAGIRRQWGGHVSLAVQPRDNVFPLPEGADLLEASIAKLAAIAYHGARLSRPLPHEKVAVAGLGPIGQLSARIHAASGARTVCADLSPERVEAARKAGLEAVVPEKGLAAAFRDVFPGGADIVVDATGFPAVLPEAIALAKEIPWDDSLTPGARFLVQGSYPDGFSIPYHAAFFKEIVFYLPRADQPRDARAVLDLMARGKLAARDLISEVRPPEEAQKVYTALRQPKGSLLTVAFQWK